MRPAVFLDRDGVLNADGGYVHDVAELRVLPRVPEALRILADRGFALIVVTNQSGIARGFYSTEDAEAFNAELSRRIEAESGARIEAFYLCPHHPDGIVAGLARVCDCRKPEPGMLLKAATDLGIDLARSYMVGDRGSDVECGVRAGCRSVQIASPGAAPQPQAIGRAASLYEALSLLTP